MEIATMLAVAANSTVGVCTAISSLGFGHSHKEARAIFCRKTILDIKTHIKILHYS